MDTSYHLSVKPIDGGPYYLITHAAVKRMTVAEVKQAYIDCDMEHLPVADKPILSGFCVRGEDSATFPERILSESGLTRREANEFIMYRLPRMQNNACNVISIQAEWRSISNEKNK